MDVPLTEFISMKLHILSDIHLELFEEYHIPHTDADLTVLAGDIHIKLNGIKWIKEKLSDRRVLYPSPTTDFACRRPA